MGSASHWLFREGNLPQQIRGITHVWVVTRLSDGISLMSAAFSGRLANGKSSSEVFKKKRNQAYKANLPIAFFLLEYNA